jgi:hypothetical protein
MSQRVLLNREALITQTLTDGTGAPLASPPSSPLVTVTNDAGLTLGSDIPAAPTLNAGEYTVTLTNAMTTQLDRLRLNWTSGGFGTQSTYVDVVGGFFFTIAELRASSPQLASTTTFTTTRLLEARTSVEDALEKVLGFAMVPRFRTQTLTGWARTEWPLLNELWPYVRVIRTIVVDEVAIEPAAFGGYDWPPGYSTVEVAYEHGLDEPGPRWKRYALMLAKNWLLDSPIDDRASTFSSVEGGTYGLVTPGLRGSIFGIPEVDAAVNEERFQRVT